VEFLLKASIWAALGFGVLSAWVRRERAFWLLGGVCLWVHAALAFHAVHGWSHAAAEAATASQVAAVTGWRSGGGLWVNYAFLIAWVWVAWQWNGLGRRLRLGWWAVVLFLGFQGAVVFAPPGSRWIGVLWTVAAAASVRRVARASDGRPAADATPIRNG
jgi:hypothetical protein